MTNTRPLLLGYVRGHSLMSEHELADVKQDLADFAERARYPLGTIYVDHVDRTPAAFVSLVDEPQCEEAKVVVVSDIHPSGRPQHGVESQEHEIGARVRNARHAHRPAGLAR